MITASIKFLTNSLMADLTCRDSELRSNLQSTGVLMPPSMIPLNNPLTLQVHLIPNDDIGRLLCDIIDTNKDTLGSVQRLCRNIYCLNTKHQTEFIRKLESGEITSVEQGIYAAQKMRAERKAEHIR